MSFNNVLAILFSFSWLKCQNQVSGGGLTVIRMVLYKQIKAFFHPQLLAKSCGFYFKIVFAYFCSSDWFIKNVPEHCFQRIETIYIDNNNDGNSIEMVQ